MQPIYLLVGIPGVGKSKIAEELLIKLRYVAHDDHIGYDYVEAVHRASVDSNRPVLAETPFSVSQIKEPLENKGHRVIPVFVIERPEVVAERYMKRENRPIPKGHLTRQQTYLRRALDGGHFHGTADEVLEHLKGL